MLVAQRQELFAMLRPASIAIVTGLTLSSIVPALAQSGVISGYAFSVENDTPSAVTLYANGKSQCSVDPGKSCRIMVTRWESTFAYATAGGTEVAFSPGNLEAIDQCKLDSAGVHCVDPNQPN
jgi:hypothetical protein